MKIHSVLALLSWSEYTFAKNLKATCAEATSKKWCNNIDGCDFMFGQCVKANSTFACHKFNDSKKSCGDNGCKYEYGKCVPQDKEWKCGNFHDNAYACKDIGCTYFENKCRLPSFKKPCDRFHDSKATCGTLSHCHYIAKQCLDVGVTEECSYWNDAPGFCKRRSHCEYHHKTGCTASPCAEHGKAPKYCKEIGCKFRKIAGAPNECVHQNFHEPCTGYETKKKCNKSSKSHCKWFWHTKSCQELDYQVPCQYFNKKTCDNTRCTYYNGTCYEGANWKEPCADHDGAKKTCKAADHCKWKPGARKCLDA